MIKYMAKVGRARGVLNMCRVPIRRRAGYYPRRLNERTSKHGAETAYREHGRGVVLNTGEKDFPTFLLGDTTVLTVSQLEREN